jgi:hypothetical protein
VNEALTPAERLDSEILNVRIAPLDAPTELRADLEWQLQALRLYRLGAGGRQERAFARALGLTGGALQRGVECWGDAVKVRLR